LYQFKDLHAAGGTAIIARDGVFIRPNIARGFGRKGRPSRSIAPDLDLVVDLGVRIG
jgi:hypothetical protein